MNKVFRSRGFRYDEESKKLSMKIYYEPDNSIIESNDFLRNLAKKMQYFEYSINSFGRVDSVNFHTECGKMDCFEPEAQSKFSMNDIRNIFDPSFRAYTIGYRLTDNVITGKSVYYYPTVWKGNRYGLKGITDTKCIVDEISRFVEWANISEKSRLEINKFARSVEKLKGLCITETNSGMVSYKLYAKIGGNNLQKILGDFVDLNELIQSYGDTVLCSIRIREGEVVGYNMYYVQ